MVSQAIDNGKSSTTEGKMKLIMSKDCKIYLMFLSICAIICLYFASEHTLKTSMPDDHVIEWKDTTLENWVRFSINKQYGDIYLSDVLEIKGWVFYRPKVYDSDSIELTKFIRTEILDVSYYDLYNIYEDSKIFDISNLGEFRFTERLDILDSNIKDISALSNLKKLQYLDLSMNHITDLRPLSSLRKLRSLDLSENEIYDINPLGSVKSLVYLSLNNNTIKDITALSNLKKLNTLTLNNNRIEDVNALASLKKKTEYIIHKQYKATGYCSNICVEKFRST